MNLLRILFLLALAGSAAAQTTVTLQDSLNNYTGTADNWIVANSGANINRGGDVNVAIRAVSDYGIYRFPIFAAEGGPVPNNATITSATLSLYKAYGPDAVMRAQRLTKAWTEMGSTWNSTGSVNWTTPGGDVISTPDGTGSVPDSLVNNCADGIGHEICWLNINVTTGVQAFAQSVASGGPSTNFGWRVSAVSSSEEFTPKNFNSRNNNSFPQYRPKLTITYTTGPTGCNSGTLRPYDGAPVNGNPIAIAASGATTFEAEHFNCGGQDVAYHDNVAGNNGAAFRATEDVDIITSTDSAGGGYVIQNFYTGEWLSYTINVAQAGTYDLAIRASADNPGSFHMEVDGVNVTGNVPVPNTGSLNTYVWVTKTGVNLTAGQHVLKLVSDQQFFWVNQLRFTRAGGTPPTASFTATPSSGDAPLVVTFDAGATTPGSGTISELRLHFDDGTPDITWTDKTQTRQKTFNLPNGPKIVTFTASNEFGPSTPVTRTINVGPTEGACIESGLTAAASGVAIPTFHSMGLYYNPNPAPSGDKIFMRYRKGSDPDAPGSWKPGHDLWYDIRNVHNYHARGSVVHLEPNTPYVFEVSRNGTTWDAYIPGPNNEKCPSTWKETADLPISDTPGPTWLNTNSSTSSSNYPHGYKGNPKSRNHVLLANQSGTADGYTLYDFTGKNATAQAANANDTYPVVVSGHHIIIRGLTIVGGASGIFIDPASTDIILENLDITLYGRETDFNICPIRALGAGLTGNRACNEDAGIYFPPPGDYGLQALDTKRIVIQHSKMHNPAFGSNPWDGTNHPEGTAPITMYPTGGQVVVRYNTTYSTTDGEVDGTPNLNRFHADGLILGGCNDSGGSNCAGRMGIGADVDIYKNLVMHYFDDGLETDGDSTNTRIWKNYFDYGGASAVSTTPTFIGPTYVWRNVYNRQREWITEQWGNENGRRDSMMKAGGIGFNGGKRYIYHNTSLQAPASSEPGAAGNPLGTGLGVKGTGGSTNGLQNTVTRNNIWHNWKTGWSAFSLADASNNDIDYDLTNSICWWGPAPTCTGSFEPNGHRQTTPSYQSGNGWLAPGGPQYHGKYHLNPVAGNKGYQDGQPIPNFNDGTPANPPDRGAHDNTMVDMDFGTTASGH